MNNRFLVDYDNPDAGIGHSMGIINRAFKIATRNGLQLTYSESQLEKSHSQSWKWKIKQFLRKLRGKKAYETHNIGNDLNLMLNLKDILISREQVEQMLRQQKVQLLELPRLQIDIPSNEQIDDEIYREIDTFIQNHSGPNIAFKVNRNLSGDYEYESTRDWFRKAYLRAREKYPIPLSFDPKKMNIAVHIRRGDLLPGRQFSDLSSRMLPDEWYLEILNTILSNTNKVVAIHIFSEGINGRYYSENGKPFSWIDYFDGAPCEVYEHIDSDFLSTFHHLINADILLGSKSGMSHLAATLSTQLKLMPKMWHSYRGSNQLLELSTSIHDLDKSSILALVHPAL